MHKCVADKYDKSQTSGTNKANSKSGCKEREKKEKLFKLQTVVCFVIKEISIWTSNWKSYVWIDSTN